MKRVWITRPGPPTVLQVREEEDPQPAHGEVRIRVHASGINFADISARVGLYPDAPKPPCVVGYEVAGVVDALGEEVTTVDLGARVASLTRFGGYTDTICVPAGQIQAIPERMPFDQAAALMVNYLTAYHCIFETGSLHPGSRVLVHMAAGGVGLAAIQLLGTLEDIEIFGTSSASKHDILREAGVAHPIDYRTTDYVEEITRIAGSSPLHLVLDALGGADWKKGYDLLCSTGRIVCFGFANMITGNRRNPFRIVSQWLKVPKFHPFKMMDKNRGAFGVHIGHLWDQEELLRRETEALMELYEKGAILPRVDARFPFEEAADAHQYIQDRKNIGKVVLTTDYTQVA